MTFVEVCALHDLQPGKARAFRVRETDVAIFNMDGALHAIENSCLHAGSALSGGALCGKYVSCPSHGWRYDITTGALAVAPELKLRTFPVKVIDGKVMLEMEQA